MNMNQVAVQMYTLREHAAVDLDATFWRLAEMGYKQVEFAGYYDNTVDDVAAMLQRHGLRAPASHVPFADFEQRFDGVLEDAEALGFEWLIVPVPPNREPSADEADELVAKLNDFGRKATAGGFKFGYHNHAFEFQKTFDSGETLFELLLAGTDPENVKFELDAFWAAVGGQDPAAILRDNPDRIRLVHIKDADPDDPTKDVPFGEGSLDWTSILEASKSATVEFYVTEQDNPGDAFEDVSVALRNAEKWSDA